MQPPLKKKFYFLGGLRAQVIVATTLLTLVLVALISILVLSIFEHRLLEDQREKASLVLAALQVSLEKLFGQNESANWSFQEIESLSTEANNLSNAFQIRGITIISKRNRVLYQPDTSSSGETLNNEELVEVFKESKVIIRLIGSKSVLGIFGGKYEALMLTGPLFAANSPVAAARIELPMEQTNRAITDVRRIVILYMVFDAVLVILLGSFWMIRFLIQPLTELTNATKRITEGNLEAIIDVNDPNEIGALADALRSLQNALKEKIRQIEQQVVSLATAKSKLTQAQQEIIQSERLAYVGRVAAGVAHEVGNPLGAVFSYLSLLKEEVANRKELTELTDRIDHELNRIDRIMRELLDFSRPGKSTGGVCRISDALEEAVGFLQGKKVLGNIKIVTDIENNLPKAPLDQGQLRQVLVNLLFNAVDVLQEEGIIRIDAHKIEFRRLNEFAYLLGDSKEKKSITFTDLGRRGIHFPDRIQFQEGETVVRINISDTGSGIAEPDLQRIFDPFFTSKPPGKGTGLGLAICQRIVESAGGIMRVESRLGEGTVFSIYLPFVRISEEERIA